VDADSEAARCGEGFPFRMRVAHTEASIEPESSVALMLLTGGMVALGSSAI
jgi:hypothetical protein